MANTLWVFGHSFSLPFNLSSPDLGWPTILAKNLDAHCVNFAEEAADNLFIYRSYLDNQHQIRRNDYVVIGWSHPSRKTFVVDQNNLAQQEVVRQSKIYRTSTADFMRLVNTHAPSLKAWLSNFAPKPRNNNYYDTWFKNYYSEIEQTTNFQGYIDSVKQTCNGNYLPFYFSKESVQHITCNKKHAGFLTEFIDENKFAISKTDAHLNAAGHNAWAAHLFNLFRA